jgi:hypothetical protein
MVQGLKGFMHPTMHNIALCDKIVPQCLLLQTRRRVLSKYLMGYGLNFRGMN